LSKTNRETKPSFGVWGSEGRCYKLFLGYSVCVDNAANPKEECRLLREDYFECLHHNKEFKRRSEVVKRWKELGKKIPEAGASEEKKDEHADHH
jgi:hypothetical protein